MKQKPLSLKRQKELERLYQPQNQTLNHFKIKNKPSSKTYNNLEKQSPLSSREFVFSLLLTFVIITIQLLISRLI